MTDEEKAARVRKYYKRTYKHGHIRWLLLDDEGTSVYCDQCGNIANFIKREYLDGMELNVAICRGHTEELLAQETGYTVRDLWVFQLEEVKRAGATFQARVRPWVVACFGETVAADVSERNYRFLEEALELVQACGITRREAEQLVDYVFARPIGEKDQEVGGVMTTVAALCLAQGLDMHEAAEVELARVWTKIEQIRAKQASRPKHSPLPQ